MVIEELLKLFVGEVDAQLLETVELLETKEGGRRGKESKRRTKVKKKKKTAVINAAYTNNNNNKYRGFLIIFF